MPTGRSPARYQIGSEITSPDGKRGHVIKLGRTFAIGKTRVGELFTVFFDDSAGLIGEYKPLVTERKFPQREDLNSRISRALHDGERAGREGISAINNPYARGTAERHAWFKGHTKGSEQYTPDRGRHVSGMGVGTWNGVTRFRTQ